MTHGQGVGYDDAKLRIEEYFPGNPDYLSAPDLHVKAAEIMKRAVRRARLA